MMVESIILESVIMEASSCALQSLQRSYFCLGPQQKKSDHYTTNLCQQTWTNPVFHVEKCSGNKVLSELRNSKSHLALELNLVPTTFKITSILQANKELRLFFSSLRQAQANLSSEVSIHEDSNHKF